MSQMASAHPDSSFSVVSGRAEVVKSRSLWSRPRMASRTGPPTRAICSPAAVKRSPSSSTRSRIPVGSEGTPREGAGWSDTGGNSMPGPAEVSLAR